MTAGVCISEKSVYMPGARCLHQLPRGQVRPVIQDLCLGVGGPCEAGREASLRGNSSEQRQSSSFPGSSALPAKDKSDPA